MSVTIHIAVEDIADKLAIPYDRIELERAASLTGAFANITNLTLVADDYNYDYEDATGTVNHYYRYRFSLAGANPSDYSNPFRPFGVSRLRIRQEVLRRYRCGIVFTAVTGDVNTVTTTDYRIKNSEYRTGRGKGQWVRPTTGLAAGQIAGIKSTSDPATGALELTPDLTAAIGVGDQIEFHWVADPQVLDDCINFGLQRYWYLDRIPINGIASRNEYSLEAWPWITTHKQLGNLWYYPDAQVLGEITGLERPWGVQGSSWRVRGNTLIVYPTLDITRTIYLDAARQMPELYTDASVAPVECDLHLAAALAYDELLKYLAQPGVGTAEDNKAYNSQRVIHSKTELRRQFQLHPVHLPAGISQTTSPDVFPSPYRGR